MQDLPDAGDPASLSEPATVAFGFTVESGSEEEPGPRGRARPAVRTVGGGLVEIPAVAATDPRSAVLIDPEVPEPQRFCWKCREPVGRAPRAISGNCVCCGAPFSFAPDLRQGDLVAGQYEVQGCLAHGGLGWVYLAIDRNVSDRWVVLKGLQNPLDFEAHVVALSERQFLSEMSHPGIVKIYNFVRHRSAHGTPNSYIVMEYVGGCSLQTMLDLRGPARFPAAEAIAYVMEALPALEYLHSFGLAYNDMKPSNIMVSEDEVKLIDLGAVAAIESYGNIYGTPGYQAPEIVVTGPSVATDIHTVGRTLLALLIEPPVSCDGFQNYELPTAGEEPLWHRYPSLHRLLARATDPSPKRRFPSAEAMHRQLDGVLRIVLAIDTGCEHPQSSLEFGSLRGNFGTDLILGQTDSLVDGIARAGTLSNSEIVAALPVPLIQATDPSSRLLSSLQHADPRHTLDALQRTYARIASGTVPEPASLWLEGRLTAARAHLDLGEVGLARETVNWLRRRSADWRIDWNSGIAALLDGDLEDAFRRFDEVQSALPGEIAPALALAATAELVLQHVGAESHRWHHIAIQNYELVWRTNRGVATAAFGLARRLVSQGLVRDAVAVLDQMPTLSRYFSVAALTGSLLLVSRPITEITADDLTAAAARLQRFPDEPRLPQLEVVVLGAALEWVRAGGRPLTTDMLLFGVDLTETGLRHGLESRLRAIARMAPGKLHRYRLVDLANHLRPRTRW